MTTTRCPPAHAGGRGACFLPFAHRSYASKIHLLLSRGFTVTHSPFLAFLFNGGCVAQLLMFGKGICVA